MTQDMLKIFIYTYIAQVY